MSKVCTVAILAQDRVLRTCSSAAICTALKMPKKRPAASEPVSNAVKKHAPGERAASEAHVQLVSLGRSSYVSQRGIKNLLQDVEAKGVPEWYSRGSQYRARKAVTQLETPYGPLVRELPVVLHRKQADKSIKQIDDTIGIQNPLAFLYYHAKTSEHYSGIVKRALANHPVSIAEPWKIVLYQDGVDPSDGLAKLHTRKSTVFYWSFLEFCMHALCHEQVWGTVTVMQTHLAKELEGSVVQLTDIVLSEFFGHKHDISRSGCALELPGIDASIKIFGRAAIFLADEPALNEMVAGKGHAGLKCCLLCVNCTLHNARAGSSALHTHSDYIKSIANPTLESFKKHTNETLRTTLQRLHDAHGSPNFEIRERHAGFSFNAHQILLNERYRIQAADAIMYDWVHCTVSDGVVSNEFEMFMTMMHRRKTETTYAELGKYVSKFSFPKNRGNVENLFDPEAYPRYLRNESFPAIASQWLTLGPVLLRYIEKVVERREEAEPYVKSLKAALIMLEILQSVKTGRVTPDQLHRVIETYFRLFVAAWGEERVRPKHHYLLHLADCLREHATLLNTFVHERKHRMVMRYTRGRSVTQKWSLSVVEEIACHTLWEMNLPFFQSYTTSKPSKRILRSLEAVFPHVPAPTFTLHDEITINGGVVSRGDVVSFELEDQLRVGRLLLNVGIASTASVEKAMMFSLVTVWEEQVGHDDTRYAYFKVTDEKTAKVKTELIDTCFTYCLADSGTSCMLCLPFECRAGRL